ncbi:uncharacterized protein [Dysidea avara]|uniref:uncharacterized protein n=1 Tax=Dysidea avara TaxID=196820 RepID=UPI003328AAA0
MELNCKAVICVSIVVLYGLTIVCSLPVGKREALPTADQEPITFNKLLPPLIDLSSSDSLFSLWRGAFDLSDENLLKAEYQQKKRKVCRGRVFYGMTGTEEKKCREMTPLTYGQLVKYYNELVVQLQLAKTIVNDSSLIPREVIEAEQTEVLEAERGIIQLLNETVLPVLEYTLAANDTNCSTTEAIVDQTISIYTNCATVQTSNLFLAQTALDLFHNLNYTINELQIQTNESGTADDDDSSVTFPAANNSKEWCIIQQ